MKWSIYRDGARWSVSAPDLLAALAEARWSLRGRSLSDIWDGTPARRYLAEGVGFEEACAPPAVAESDKPALYMRNDGGDEDDSVDRACYAGLENDTTAVVVKTAASEDVRTVDVLECLERAVETARAAACTTKRYVRTYASGKRAGQPKFAAADDATRREQIKADHAFNVARHSNTVSSREASHAIFDVLSLLDATGVDTARVRKLAFGVAYDDDPQRELHMWLLAENARAAKEEKAAAEVAVNGFAVGDRCTITPSGFDDDPICGPAKVLSACLDGDRLVYSPEWGDVYVSTTRLKAWGT